MQRYTYWAEQHVGGNMHLGLLRTSGMKWRLSKGPHVPKMLSAWAGLMPSALRADDTSRSDDDGGCMEQSGLGCADKCPRGRT